MIRLQSFPCVLTRKDKSLRIIGTKFTRKNTFGATSGATCYNNSMWQAQNSLFGVFKTVGSYHVANHLTKFGNLTALLFQGRAFCRVKKNKIIFSGEKIILGYYLFALCTLSIAIVLIGTITDARMMPSVANESSITNQHE